ncbi:hypothetical protein R9C00_11190 [Flammeovirgaceae bacterium SG7u.111]|nr:hypothetical protein [Flammeovirgaceae bacterium SG7u.132]WPO38016.1 hypothetical protein R9C00_11190 [Flammeovirgaceae bacterium SG7u.111]
MSKGKKYFTPSGGNTHKLNLIPYLIFTGLYVGVVLGLTYLWCTIFSIEVYVWQVFKPKYFLVSLGVWIAVGFSISTHLKGMEGNILGFIFFPILLLCAIVLVGVNVMDVVPHFLSIESPKLPLNLWLRVLLHVFLPIYMVTIINSDAQKKEDDGLGWLSTTLTSLIMQLMLFGVHWLVIYAFGTSISFSQFFGEGQTVLYYSPMLGGFLFYITYLFSQVEALEKVSRRIQPMLIFVGVISVILQIINYFTFIKDFF